MACCSPSPEPGTSTASLPYLAQEILAVADICPVVHPARALLAGRSRGASALSHPLVVTVAVSHRRNRRGRRPETAVDDRYAAGSPVKFSGPRLRTGGRVPLAVRRTKHLSTWLRT